MWTSIRCLWLIGLVALWGVPQTLWGESPDFNREVRPLLSGRCFKCHGPDAETREAGLRLDQAEGSRAALDSGERAIVPGQPQASALIERITTTDPNLRMPPPSEGDALTPAEIELLQQWIAEGAGYAEHWAFVPPQRPPLPAVSNPDWCRNGIDHFVLQRLDVEKLQPTAQADRETLIRRLSLDLIGLPPSAEEVRAFVQSSDPQAYEQLVDRLLASPAFGEHWARPWLDLARYADSAGYADDPPRTIWRYRDWVIDAINADMPQDQFAVEQLAGDLLPEPTETQLTATAFHRNTMTNSEGGTDDEEFRVAAVVDRVNTTLQVWMGLTMACAQCHTHKYDPITQEEYFRVYAIFNQSADNDRRDEAPLLETWTPELLARKETLQQQLTAAQALLTELQQVEAASLDKLEIPAGPLPVRFVRIDLPGKKEFLSLAEVQVFAGDQELAQGKPARQSSTAYDGPAGLAVDGNTDGDFFAAKSTTHTEQQQSPWWEVDLQQPASISQLVIWNRSDSPGVGKRLDGFRVVLLDAERRPLWVKTGLPAPAKDSSIPVPASGAEISREDRLAMLAYLGQNSPVVEEQKAKVAALEKSLASIQPVTVPIMRELPVAQRRKTHIQLRGNFLDLGPEVQPGFPAAFHPGESSEPTRLDFAKWVIDPANPLTARVLANRDWESLFGVGLVETSEDFGLQGDLPSHPQLLDWLAVEYQRLGWSRKAFLKQLVMSATYQQSSDVTAELVARDPKNRLLARGARFRLSAEMIRDQALSIAGLLSEKQGGPSVNPPRPVLGLRAAFGGSTDWETSPGEDKYRRGLYTTWRRSIPYPSMDTFDAPSREVCTVRRIRTNTPLQALVTLNDPVYIEAAQGLAGRMLREGGNSDSERLAYGFLLCTAREPDAEERAVLAHLYDSARQRFSTDPAAAKALLPLRLEEGESAATEPSRQADLAAWTVVANVLLNLDETLTRR